jgi:hypothetical protein
MTLEEWKAIAGRIDLAEMYGANQKNARQRPLVKIKCTTCAKSVFSRRLRGKWTGQIQIIAPLEAQVEVVHNIIEAPYICAVCRKNGNLAEGK